MSVYEQSCCSSSLWLSLEVTSTRAGGLLDPALAPPPPQQQLGAEQRTEARQHISIRSPARPRPVAMMAGPSSRSSTLRNPLSPRPTAVMTRPVAASRRPE